MNCLCDTGLDFANCCQPYITLTKPAPSPEALMRSRFTAYATKHYSYVLSTYAKETALDMSAEALANANDDTCWLRLELIAHESDVETGMVQFKAYYQVGRRFFCMHERSRFSKQDGLWCYVDGDMLDGSGELKLGRNDPCICGSNKKFKRCCQS